MPCFSASNVRFVSAEEQMKEIEQKERSRAATATVNPFEKRKMRTGPEFLHLIPQRCRDYFASQGVSKRQLEARLQIYRKPKYEPHHHSTKRLLPSTDLDKIKEMSKVVTIEERLEEMKEQERQEQRMEIQAEVVRRHFKNMDMARKRAMAPKVVEKTDDEIAKSEVLQRAFLARQEDEEEVKRVNRIILDAKCHAIRDAQVAEKAENLRTEKESNRRIEHEVLKVAFASLQAEDAKMEKERQLKLAYATGIRAQLEERAKIRFLEAERIEEEAKLNRAAMEALKAERELEKRMDRERRVKFREELQRLAAMSRMFKRMLCEQENEAEMRIARYMRQKEERQKQLQIEAKVAKEEYERKQQRIFQLAQKAYESRSTREEMTYIRQKELIEREHRRKEKMAAIRKKEIEKELLEARELQREETKRRQALCIARAEKDFKDLESVIAKEEQKQRELAEKREIERTCYRKEILKQMTDKEVMRRRLCDMEVREGRLFKEAERKRNLNMRAVIQAKLDSMRDACLPERYIKDVERQMARIVALTPPKDATLDDDDDDDDKYKQ